MATLKSRSMVLLGMALLVAATAVASSSTVVTTVEDVVDPLDGVVSLREAVAAAEAGETAQEGRHLITFAIPGNPNPVIAPQTPIVVTNSTLFTAERPLEINGANGGGRVIFDGRNQVQLFQVFEGAGVSLSNCTVKGGLAELGGGIASNGPLTLNQVTFYSCAAQFMGGAVFGPDVQAENCSFVECEAVEAGGAVYVDYESEQGAAFSAVNCAFWGNFVSDAEGAGGAVYARAGCNVAIDGACFFSNAADWGGAVYLGDCSLAQIKNATFVNNVSAWGYSGVVYSMVADLTLSHVTSWNNVCGEGEPILVENYLGDVKVQASLIGESQASSELSDAVQSDSVTVWGAADSRFLCEEGAPVVYCLPVGGVAQHFLKPASSAVFTGQARDQFDQLGSARVAASPTLGAIDYAAVPPSGTPVAMFSSTFVWAPAGGGHWTLGANWNQWIAPDGSDSQVVFGDAGGAATVSVSGAQPIGGLTFDNPAGYTLSGGEIIFASPSPTIRVESGTQVIASTVSATGDRPIEISCAPGGTLVFDGPVNAPIALTGSNVRFGEHAQINGTVTCPSGFTGTGTFVMDGNGTLEIDGGFDKDYSFSGTIDARGGEVRLGQQGLPNATVELGVDATLSTVPARTGMTGRFYSLQSEKWGLTDDEKKDYYNNNGVEAKVNDLAGFQTYVATCPAVTNFFFATDGLVFDDRNAPSDFPQDCHDGSCPNFWAAVFEGAITVPTNGTYTFRAKADDAFVLAIDGVKRGSAVKCAETSFTVNLGIGPHSFYLGILECTGYAYFYLDVKMPGETEFHRVPADWFTDAPRHGLLTTFRSFPSADATQNRFDNVVVSKIYDLTTFKNYMETCPVVQEYFFGSEGLRFDDENSLGGFPAELHDGAYPNFWAAIFDGTLSIPESGWYNFRGKADDAFLLAIDGEVCLASKKCEELSGGVYLERGPHSIYVGMLERTGSASFFLNVQAPSDSGFRPLPLAWLTPRTGAKELSGTGKLAPAAGTVLTMHHDAFSPATFTGVLAGEPGSVFAKTGTGGMSLTGRTGGDLLLEEGDLAVVAQNGVFDAVDSILGAGTLSLTGATSIANLYGGGGVSFGGEAVSLAPAAGTRATFTGDLSGSAQVTVAGPGTQELGGTVTLDRPLVVAGPLILANGADVKSGIDFRSGASLEMRGGSSVGVLTGTAPISLAYGDHHPYGALRDDGTFTPLGPLNVRHMTGDADCGISPSKKYLLAFNYCKTVLTNTRFLGFDLINEVPFRRSYTQQSMSEYEENAMGWTSGCSLRGVPGTQHFSGGEGNIGVSNSQAIYGMLTEFTYAIDQSGNKYSMELSGLTPGNTYELRLYERSYGDTERPVRFEFDPSGRNDAETMITQTVNIDSTAYQGKDSSNHNIYRPYTLGFRFTALSTGYTINWTSLSSADTWHLYGASLEQYDPAANVRTFDLAQNATFAGAISGIGEVAKTGAGTLKLTGSVNAEGFWSVKGGSLLLTSSFQTLGSVAVADAAFGGIGKVKEDVGVASDAKLQLSGILQVGGKLAIGEGATVIVEGNGMASANTMALPSTLSIRASGRETTSATVLFSGSQDLSGVDLSHWTVYNRAGTAVDHSGWVMKSADNKSILLKTSLSPAGGGDEVTNSDLVANCDLEKVSEWIETQGLDVEAVNASPYALTSFLMNTPLQAAAPELAIVDISQDGSGNWRVKVHAEATYGGSTHDVPLGQGSTPSINGKLTLSVAQSLEGPWSLQTYSASNLSFDAAGDATIVAPSGRFFKAVITP